MKRSRWFVYSGAILLVSVAAAGITLSWFSLFWPGNVGLLGEIDPNYVALDSLQLGTHTVQFYVDYHYDSAVLGYSVEDRSGHIRYFPMYGSTYRGLPAVNLDVYVSDTEDEMWVISSWSEQYRELGYYRAEPEIFMTGCDVSTPSSSSVCWSASAGPSPMDPKSVEKRLTIQYDD